MRNLDISNGENIGVSLFVQGCHFHCNNCFNSETWDFEGGYSWTEKSIKDFLNLINRSYIKRVSILGGEPLTSRNVEEIFHLISTIRKLFPTKTIWLYTGFTWEQIMNPTNSDDILRKEIVSQCDVVVDGEYIDELRDITLKWRGSSNQRVIDVKKSIEKGEVVLWSD
jgi:anaerobic ribonucleoside-triphosphate reductase activating protein